MYRKNRLAILLVALLACVVACALALQPLSSYAAENDKLMAGTPAQVSTTSASALAKAKITSMKSYKAGTVKVKAAKVAGASGYQFRIALNKGLSMGVKSKTTTARSFVFKKCAQGYKYYAKVRAYKVVNGKKVFGPWSDIKGARIMSGGKVSVCKSRMAGTWEMVSGTGVSAATVKQAKAKGLTYKAIVKGNKLYIYQVYKGKRTLQANGAYTLNVKSKTRAIAKQSGYYNLTLNVAKSKLTITENSKTISLKRL